jgi:hypothetical protein
VLCDREASQSLSWVRVGLEQGRISVVVTLGTYPCGVVIVSRRTLTRPLNWSVTFLGAMVVTLVGNKRLDVSPLTHILPSLMETSHSLGSILVGVLYMLINHLII